MAESKQIGRAASEGKRSSSLNPEPPLLISRSLSGTLPMHNQEMAESKDDNQEMAQSKHNIGRAASEVKRSSSLNPEPRFANGDSSKPMIIEDLEDHWRIRMNILPPLALERLFMYDGPAHILLYRPDPPALNHHPTPPQNHHPAPPSNYHPAPPQYPPPALPQYPLVMPPPYHPVHPALLPPFQHHHHPVHPSLLPPFQHHHHPALYHRNPWYQHPRLPAAAAGTGFFHPRYLPLLLEDLQNVPTDVF